MTRQQAEELIAKVENDEFENELAGEAFPNGIPADLTSEEVESELDCVRHRWYARCQEARFLLGA